VPGKHARWCVIGILLAVVSVMTMGQFNYKVSAMAPPENSIELIHGSGEPSHSIIWLHGLGATANDFPPIVPELGLIAGRTIRFVFPQAPDRPITINAGMRMPGWYDIKGLDIKDKQDAEGMAESKAILDGLIERELERGIASQNIIVAGFSQGGAVAYFSAVRSRHELGGVLALSTYLPFADETQTQQSGTNITTPIFASHGTFDPVVPIDLGKVSVNVLSDLGYSVVWKTYPMEHNVVMEQIKDIGAWINDVFSDGE